MKSRWLRSAVDRLPTISEMQESNTEEGDPDCSSHTMEEYVDSIKELSQPAPYPLHGPLRGHRLWMVRSCPAAPPVAPALFLKSLRSSPPWSPVDLSDVSLTFTDQSKCETSTHFKQNLLDVLVGQSLFAGLVWGEGSGRTADLCPRLPSAPPCMIHLCVRSNWVRHAPEAICIPFEVLNERNTWNKRWKAKNQGQNKQMSSACLDARGISAISGCAGPTRPPGGPPTDPSCELSWFEYLKTYSLIFATRIFWGPQTKDDSRKQYKLGRFIGSHTPGARWHELQILNLFRL